MIISKLKWRFKAFLIRPPPSHPPAGNQRSQRQPQEQPRSSSEECDVSERTTAVRNLARDYQPDLDRTPRCVTYSSAPTCSPTSSTIPSITRPRCARRHRTPLMTFLKSRPTNEGGTGAFSISLCWHWRRTSKHQEGTVIKLVVFVCNEIWPALRTQFNILFCQWLLEVCQTTCNEYN